MEILVAVLSIVGAVSLGAMSPGPSFIMVARMAVAVSRKDGVAAALGMGIGGLVFAAAAILGLQAILNAVPLLYVIAKAFGGVYLLYLGYKIWRGAGEPIALLAVNSERNSISTSKKSFLLGLATQISNPKTAVVYASIFVSLLPRELPMPVMVGLPLLIFVVEAGWYSIVALVLSAPSPRATYLRSKSKLDRVAGGVMAALGIKLIFEARQL